MRICQVQRTCFQQQSSLNNEKKRHPCWLSGQALDAARWPPRRGSSKRSRRHERRRSSHRLAPMSAAATARRERAPFVPRRRRRHGVSPRGREQKPRKPRPPGRGSRARHRGSRTQQACASRVPEDLRRCRRARAPRGSVVRRMYRRARKKMHNAIAWVIRKTETSSSASHASATDTHTVPTPPCLCPLPLRLSAR